MYIGTQINELREQKNIALETLSLGICADESLRNMELGKEAVNRLFMEILFQRLGKSTDKLELIVSEEVYEEELRLTQKTNLVTGLVCSGRTSGTGSAIDNVALRDAYHHMNSQGYGQAVLDKSSTNYEAIREREQMLIDANGGAQSMGGTSGNAINGIGANNVNGVKYINCCPANYLELPQSH